MLEKYILLFNTVRHLKFKQIYYRVYYGVRTLKLLNEVEGVDVVAPTHIKWRGDCYTPRSIFSDGTARFLNDTKVITAKNIWNDESHSKLWLYNLHYFDDLNAINSQDRAAEQQRFIHRWIEQNPESIGNGWEPYPLSLRTVNIIKWCWRNKIEDFIIHRSLLQQANALEQQLEYHILANHLFANIKALIFIGVYLNEPLGHKLLNKGLKELKHQMSEQFLQDGAHYELSPMYHSVMLWDVLELIDLAQVTGNLLLTGEISQWETIATKAISWLTLMCHPDGDISFFNDAAIGIAPSLKKIQIYAGKLGIALTSQNDTRILSMPESGYTRMNLAGENNVLLINHADIKPKYQPGHAHADTLSFELSLQGHRVFVNTGTSQYGLGEERNRQRSTPVHNTLNVNFQDSSQVWHGFRVANRAKVIQYDQHSRMNIATVSAAHNGYTRLNKKWVHHRTFASEIEQLVITDALAGAKAAKANVRYHLHPDVKLKKLTEEQGVLQLLNGVQVNLQVQGGKMRLGSFHYFPQFGVKLISEFIEVNMSCDELCFTVTWNA